MGSLTTRVVNRVSSRPSASQATFVKSDIDYDFAVAGIPLLSGISKERPYVRKTGPYRKDQVDTTPVPGEQSMVFWWLRSQQSFHGGTGIIFEEPALEASILYADPQSATAIPVRYQDSEGVDPFTTPGHVTLLPQARSQGALGATSILLDGVVVGTTDYYLESNDTSFYLSQDGLRSAITWGGTGTILSIANDGTNYYAADSTGIYKGTLSGPGAGSKLWNTGSSKVVIKWVKDRLVACIGLSLYELVGGTPPTLPTAIYTSQRPDYTWTAIEEGPDGIYLAGHDSNVSTIWYVGITTGAGNVPVLSAPKEIAQLPKGEVVYCLKEVLGSYLAIGSNRGVRIATFDNSGHISYGPIIATVPSGGGAVQSLTTYDRFIFAGWSNGMADGTSGVACIDLGYQTSTNHFAWAKWLRAHTAGTVTSVSLLGASNRLVFGVAGHGVYLENNVSTIDGALNHTYESAGYLQTGNIRFHTQEKKLYKYLKLEANVSDTAVGQTTSGSATIAVTMNDSGGGSTSVTTLGSTGGTPDFALPNSGPLEWVNFTFTLNAATINSGTAGNGPTPTLYSYQAKALPAQKNQRLFVLPVQLFDKMKDKNSVSIGYEGYVKDTLESLESLEEARDIVTFQDFSRHPFTQRLVVIDDIEFQQTDQPTEATGQGGYAQLTLRTVD